ncbi:precorrin-6A reductase [Methanobacterium aggregans]|uniref:precorrin-6A reductase n=1 Tax=Methanobacterium aggregans TaxID=1615586 RepID=UPI00320F208B
MRIMVMAGTRDAVRIIEGLTASEDNEVLATTTTRYGGELARSAGASHVISRGLGVDEMVQIISQKNIEVLVDATHPFAAEATKNAIEASKIAGIKYIRFERPQIPLPEDDLIYEVRSFEEAASKVKEIAEKTLEKGAEKDLKDKNNLNPKIMHLAGVSTIHHLTKLISPENIVARVVPSIYSLNKCFELEMTGENIMAMQGTFSKDFNKVLMEEYHASVVLTKESGETGGTPSKIDAALELGIPVVVVTRPEVPELKNEKVFGDVNQLLMEFHRDSD